MTDKNIKLAITDIDGILRGKYINKDKYKSVLKNGLGFCDVVFGWDSQDALYEHDSYTGWAKAFPDAVVTLDETTLRNLPTENNKSQLILGDFYGDSAQVVCPRSLLRRVLEQADHMGYTALVAAEFEFFMFNETPHSIREKQYKNLTTMTPDMFGYSILRNSTHAEFYHDLLNMCAEMDIEIEGLHTETGPGVLESALTYDTALRMADKAVLFKTFTKVLAQQQNMMACFMAKWSAEYPGQSGHLHISLQDKHKQSVFYDTDKPNTISDTMRYFIGGQQKLMPEILAMVAHTCNSYTRLIPGFWAPTHASWGVDNRTCALRAITGTQKSQRVEYRVAAADINPYLAIAAAIGSGLWGIQNKVKPTAPVQGNAYTQPHDDSIKLPTTLLQSATNLKNSQPAKDIFGEAFVTHYAYTRKHEYEQQRRAITDWQLQRYFEII